MLKKIISPVQSFLLKNNQCVACGRLLAKQKTKKQKNKSLVYCKCGRIYIKQNNQYRRALFEEV